MDRTTARKIIGSPFFSVPLMFVLTALKFYGVGGEVIGKLCLVGAWLVGVAGVVFSEWLWNRSIRDKIFISIMSSVAFGAMLFALNNWALAHRPDSPKVAEVTVTPAPALRSPSPTPPAIPLSAAKPRQPKPLPTPKVLRDPRYATVTDANAVAEKIENVGDDCKQQIIAQMVASAQRQAHGIPAKDSDDIGAMRARDIRKYEQERYQKNYMEEALSLRASMLELIPDISLYGLDTTFSEREYRGALFDFDYKAIAENLRKLAVAYKAKLDSMPSAEASQNRFLAQVVRQALRSPKCDSRAQLPSQGLRAASCAPGRSCNT